MKTLFKNFSYKFGGKFFHQKEGGPIGVRATGAASELVMEDWATKYRDILVKSGLIVYLMAGCVDDGRQITTILPLGTRFDKDETIFKHSEEAQEEDEKLKNKGESENQRMARLLIDAMNSVNKDLVFTTETQEDFKSERLPTLDFEMWVTPENKIEHSFYQKPMKTPLLLMERSGMSNQKKYQILSNDLTRRLSNIQVETIPPGRS